MTAFNKTCNVRGAHDCVRGLHAWCVRVMLGCAFGGEDVPLWT